MLKEILENAVLTEEVKESLSEAFETAIETHKQELNEQYELKQEEAMSQVHSLVESALESELDALAEELRHARTLEVQYADKFEQFKEAYAEEASLQVANIVRETVEHELDELRESIEDARKARFGTMLYETFRDAYVENFGGGDMDVVEELRTAQLQLEQYERDNTINNLLEGFTGKKRNIMQTMLEDTETEKLYERFETVHKLVLAEVNADVDDDEDEDEDDGEEKKTTVKENQMVGDDTMFLESSYGSTKKDVNPVQMILAKSLKF